MEHWLDDPLSLPSLIYPNSSNMDLKLFLMDYATRLLSTWCEKHCIFTLFTKDYTPNPDPSSPSCPHITHSSGFPWIRNYFHFPHLFHQHNRDWTIPVLFPACLWKAANVLLLTNMKRNPDSCWEGSHQKPRLFTGTRFPVHLRSAGSYGNASFAVIRKYNSSICFGQ